MKGAQRYLYFWRPFQFLNKFLIRPNVLSIGRILAVRSTVFFIELLLAFFQGTAVTNKKKVESQVAELEQQLELANRLKDDYNRQLKKYQQIIKELQHDSEETRLSKEELANSSREMERKCVL